MESNHWPALLALIAIFFISNLGNVQGQEGILCFAVIQSFAHVFLFIVFFERNQSFNLYCKLCVAIYYMT